MKTFKSGAFDIWQATYAGSEAAAGQVVYQTGMCPDLLLNESGGRHWLYRNPPFFSPAAYTGRSLEELIGNPKPYILASRSLLKLLEGAGRSPFNHSERVIRLLVFHCGGMRPYTV